MRMSKKMWEQARAQIEATKKAVARKLCDMKPHPLGHYFLWGYVEFTVKTTRGLKRKGRSRTILYSGCADDMGLVCAKAQEVPGVTSCWCNLD